MRRLGLWLLLALLPCMARAHVGSKDVFQTVHAGTYELNVTIRPPEVIPGIATVEVRSTGARVSGISIVPLPLAGEASKHPPTADTMERSKADGAFYSGGVWIMAAGTWQVRFRIDGEAGEQTVSVPVLAVPLMTLKMKPGMGAGLGLLGVFLIVTMAGTVAAAVRESRLRAGLQPTPGMRRNGLIATLVSLTVMVAAVVFGGWWWHAEAASYADNIYHPPATSTMLQGNQLDLLVKVFNPHPELPDRFGYKRANDDYVPDHGRLIHLYAIREPAMDAVYHLHPALVAPGDFRLALPSMPAGHYRLYGDVVHATGFPETLQATVDVPAGMTGAAKTADDAEAHPTPVSAGASGDLGPSYHLPDGYTIVWARPPQLTAEVPYTFRFQLLDGAGRPAGDMQPYLGMAGHAAFVKVDGSVFAHTHPEGSAAMADLMMANPMDGMEDPGPIASEVGFPYGFPSAGHYRIFVQMKHGSTVETGAFDARVQ